MPRLPGESGGALSIGGSGANTAVITNTTFASNSARKAGALVITAPVTGAIRNCSFADNAALVAGAVLIDFTEEAAAPGFDVSGCSFLRNAGSDGAGGALLHTGQELRISVDYA
jgi:hypothetical protein